MGAASWPRTVEVLGAHGGCGSGTLVAPGLVLTALHVVSRTCGGQVSSDARIRVRVLRDRQEHLVEVVWVGDRELDAVLLRADPSQLGRGLAPVRWGELTCPSPDVRPECSAVGFPQAMRRTTARPDGSRAVVHDSRQVVGHVSAVTGLNASKYDMDVSNAHPAQASGDNGWSGLSGAGLFCHEILIGVVEAVPPAWRGQTLWVLPVRRLLALADFTSVITEHAGVAPQLESADQSPLFHEAPVPRLSPSYLLSPQAEVVPFTGMQEEIAALTSWCTSSRVVDVAVVFGPGGVGKTRLATELIRRITRRRSPWTAGFLSDVQRASSALDALKTNLRPLLLVLDYAETRMDQVEEVLRLFAGSRHAFDKVRVLLLARPTNRWWTDLEMEWRGSPVMEQGTEVRLTPASVHQGVGTVRNFEVATQAFRQRIAHLSGLDGSLADWDEPSVTEVPDASSNEHVVKAAEEVVVSIHMAALAQVLEDTEFPAADTVRPVDVLLAHESRYWRHSARAHGLENLFSTQRDLLRQLVAVQRITGAEKRRDALNAVMAALRFHDRDFGTPQLPDRERIRRIEQMLADLYPATDGARWGTMSPDILAAELIAQADRDSDNELITHILPDADLSTTQQHRALTVLARASTHQPALTGSIVRAVTVAADVLLSTAVDVTAELPSTDAAAWLTALKSAAAEREDTSGQEVVAQLGRIDDLLDQLVRSTSPAMEQVDAQPIDSGPESGSSGRPSDRTTAPPMVDGVHPSTNLTGNDHTQSSTSPGRSPSSSARRAHQPPELAIYLPAQAFPGAHNPVPARFRFTSGAFIDGGRQQRLDRALGLLTEEARRSGSPLPAINTILLGVDGTIDLNLAVAAPAIPPFHSDGRNAVWRCGGDRTLLLDSGTSSSLHAYPALVHLGWRPDGTVALADLEQVRLIHIDGPHSQVQNILGELAFELEARPRDSRPHVHVSGIPEDLHSASRSTSHESLEATLGAARAHAAQVRSELQSLGLKHPRDARLRDASNDLWRPRILLACHQISVDTAKELKSIFDARPLACLGVVTSAPPPGDGPVARWTITIDPSAAASKRVSAAERDL
ncbi:trypsin-like peptidase domain-containing protein [Kitasatospora sp. NPDC059803]|uniref:trypsin-like peptidase domain-containing protein n=1 Tax=Kitasatospora sp. NPDC059803 TaxID=3346953 RepID=UPI0036552C25